MEGIIQENVGPFYEIGDALMKIREKKYYHYVLGYKTFEEYCRKRWDFVGRHTERFMAIAKVIENTRPMGRIPDTERQAVPSPVSPPTSSS